LLKRRKAGDSSTHGSILGGLRELHTKLVGYVPHGDDWLESEPRNPYRCSKSIVKLVAGGERFQAAPSRSEREFKYISTHPLSKKASPPRRSLTMRL